MCIHIKRKTVSEHTKVVNTQPLIELSPVVYSSTLFRLLSNIMGSMRASRVSKAKISQMF